MCEGDFHSFWLPPIVIFQLSLLSLVMGSVPVIVAEFGRDVTIPCTFQPDREFPLRYLVLTWQLSVSAQVIHSYYYQQEQLTQQDPVYHNRTQLFVQELAQGNASLRLRAVRLMDQAEYLCSVSTMLQRSSHTVSLRVAAPYSEPKVTFDMGNCSGPGLVNVSSSGGYPKPEVGWIAAGCNNVTEESRTVFWTGRGGLYSMVSSIPIPLGPASNYTFILENPLLGQHMVRPLAIVGSCQGEASSPEHRLHLSYGLAMAMLATISLGLGFLLFQSCRESRRNRTL
ncbi:CD276 antigen-like [Hemiscyllium ocellatum]|uniref:CD276 antigen-like n=1 Tax=Hemiscyllium ocellatum TaxID=170820 RepID=UPI0029676F31|nr:CD276 antigen-like [Hemiscyllium ocellatum]XP_060678212.1 CD276 antigen-like [Hemiscyllium ocellatum]XP_060678213.1 CD276 antigen-like [Hemiscyllium ocellatum]XP_060678214.1 CD276 antigen-like [Hemiscyllium ocellatum]XP_060678215.1 CD276 antigen-like [Hemiscyllium ocellatum]